MARVLLVWAISEWEKTQSVTYGTDQEKEHQVAKLNLTWPYMALHCIQLYVGHLGGITLGLTG